MAYLTVDFVVVHCYTCFEAFDLEIVIELPYYYCCLNREIGSYWYQQEMETGQEQQ